MKVHKVTVCGPDEDHDLGGAHLDISDDYATVTFKQQALSVDPVDWPIVVSTQAEGDCEVVYSGEVIKTVDKATMAGPRTTLKCKPPRKYNDVFGTP